MMTHNNGLDCNNQHKNDTQHNVVPGVELYFYVENHNTKCHHVAFHHAECHHCAVLKVTLLTAVMLR